MNERIAVMAIVYAFGLLRMATAIAFTYLMGRIVVTTTVELWGCR